MARVYLAECRERGMLKIGRTRFPASRRVRSLFRTVSGEWALVDTFDFGYEAGLHRQLAEFRHPDRTGREWYLDCQEVRDAFQSEKCAVIQRLREGVKAAEHNLYGARLKLKQAREDLKLAQG